MIDKSALKTPMVGKSYVNGQKVLPDILRRRLKHIIRRKTNKGSGNKEGDKGDGPFFPKRAPVTMTGALLRAIMHFGHFLG